MIEISSKHFSMRHDDHDHDDEDNEGAITAKIVAMCVLFVASMLLGCLPIRLSTWLKWDKSIKQNQTVKLLLCIGGGVLLSTTFIHLLPEVNEQIEDLQTDGVIPELDFHLGHLLMCAGFFVMYLVEELVHTYLDHRRKGNLETLRRTLSVRRGESDKTSEELPKSANGQKLAGPNDYDHGHGEHHHHSHVDHSHVVFEDTVVSSIRGLLIVLALSVHELFEGLAVGLESSTSNVWLMFGAVSAHKLVIAFCIGVELVYSGTKTVLSVIYIFTFAVVSPLGIGIGIAVTENTDTETSLVSVILQGFACGTLLYVVFFEVLQGDRKIGLKSWLAVLAGFAVMFVITIFSIGAGIALSASGRNEEDVTSIILQGMAAGTLLYVVFFEVLAREKNNRHSGIWQLIAITAGFAVMFALQLATGHSHSHSHNETSSETTTTHSH